MLYSEMNKKYCDNDRMVLVLQGPCRAAEAVKCLFCTTVQLRSDKDMDKHFLRHSKSFFLNVMQIRKGALSDLLNMWSQLCTGGTIWAALNTIYNGVKYVSNGKLRHWDTDKCFPTCAHCPVSVRKYPLNRMSRFSPLVGNSINQCIMETGRQKQQGQLRRPTVSN